MECKFAKEVDEYDENLSCYHKVKVCTLNKKPCQGTDGVCSKFEALETKSEEKSDKMPEDKAEPEKKEEEEEKKEEPAE